MIIKVITDDLKITLPFPTSLACSGLVARIAAKHAGGNISAEQLSRLFKEIRRYRRSHGSWTLIDAQDSDGTHITVRV